VLKVWDRTNKTRLRKVDSNYVADNDFDAVLSGKPQFYMRLGTYIQLFPTPDGLYVIEMLFRNITATLINDGDIPAVPSPWHRGIVIYATYMYYADQARDQQKATFAFNEFNAWVKTKPVEVQDELADLDQGVEIPTLSREAPIRTDFDHSS
jgi:hypothetical protein